MPETVINGPVGRLEVRYSQAKEASAPLALILHPHPEQGGTMHNKVVYTMYKVFASLGFHVARFNFRGVGKSEGKFDFGEGELADAIHVLDWFQKQNPKHGPIWLSGFSFGSWIAMQLLMRRPDIKAFIAAGPPVNIYDFTFLAPCPRDGFIIQGNEDEIVSPKASQELAARLKKQHTIDVDFKMIEGADHFFTNKLDMFAAHMLNYIQRKQS